MKKLVRKPTLVCTSFIILGLAFAVICDAEIDPGAIEGLWLFDEGKGDVAEDSSGNGRDGEILGAKWVDGKFGKALEFDGIDDAVVINGYFGIGGAEPRTTVLWWNGSDIIRHSWVRSKPKIRVCSASIQVP